MRSSRGPCGRRADNCGRRHGNVLRRREALRGTVTREVRAVVVRGILLFIRREVTKVRLHRGDVRLVLRIRKLRDRNRGKNADDYDDDQKLDKSKTLFIPQHKVLPPQIFGCPPAMYLTSNSAGRQPGSVGTDACKTQRFWERYAAPSD